MSGSLGFLDPINLMLDYPIIAIGFGVAAAYFLARIEDRKRRVSALALLCVLPVAAFFIAQMLEGCQGDIPESVKGALGLTKREECWGKYGFGGVFFLGMGVPVWLVAVAAGIILRRFARR